MFGGTWETIPKPNVTSCSAGTGACAAGRLSQWALALPSGMLRAKLEPDGNAEAHYHQLQCWISTCGEVLRYSDVIKMGSACEKDGQRLVVLVFVGMMWTARPEPNAISATMVEPGAPALWGLGGIASACTCDVRWHPWVEVCAWQGRHA